MDPANRTDDTRDEKSHWSVCVETRVPPGKYVRARERFRRRVGSSHIIVYRRTFRISPRQLRRPVVIIPRNPLRKKEDTTKRIDVACTKRSAAFCIRGTGLGGTRRYYTFGGVGVGPGHVTENDDVRGRPQRRMGKQCGGPCENGKIPRRGGEKNAGVSSFAQRVLPGRNSETVDSLASASRPR